MRLPLIIVLCSCWHWYLALATSFTTQGGEEEIMPNTLDRRSTVDPKIIKKGELAQLVSTPYPAAAYPADLFWYSSSSSS
jgi:hypothetical protein